MLPTLPPVWHAPEMHKNFLLHSAASLIRADKLAAVPVVPAPDAPHMYLVSICVDANFKKPRSTTPGRGVPA